MTTTIKASDYVIQRLVAAGVHHVFQLIGGAITHLVDSTIDCPDMYCITMHHEQAAAFAAEGYARCNGTLGVAMATSGPGATNLITGIGSCFFDSVPALFITGQVNTYEYKFDKPVRQIGFQETDIVSIIKPITKGARLVTIAEELPEALEWAIQLAQSGRPGPVLLDIPMNIQRSELALSALPPLKHVSKIPMLDSTLLTQIVAALAQAKRPVILVGGGVRCAQATAELAALVSKTGIPVVASLMGLDAFPHTHPAYVGMIGTYGNRYANLTIANADFLLILGSRLDTRQTGTQPATFARAAKIVHVDIDEPELNRVVKAHYPVHADVKTFLTAFNQLLAADLIKPQPDWLERIRQFKSRFPSFPLAENAQRGVIDANECMFELSQQAAPDAIIVLDVGQHQMWAAQSFVLKPQQRMLISGGMGSMGFALPVAIGAAFAEPERQIIVITGDGGFQMNMQELQTIIRNRLSIKIILINNRSLGMVRQFQQVYFNNRTEGTVEGYDCPDFQKVVTAYDVPAFHITRPDEVRAGIARMLAENTSMLEVVIPQDSLLAPKLYVNCSIEDQDPKISREELQELMLIPVVSP